MALPIECVLYRMCSLQSKDASAQHANREFVDGTSYCQRVVDGQGGGLLRSMPIECVLYRMCSLQSKQGGSAQHANSCRSRSA
jgi:hypothetical protein